MKLGYSNETYKQAREMLEKQRIRNERELENRRAILYKRSPRAEQLEQSIARTSISAARIIFKGGNVKEEMEKLKEKNLAAQAELESIIRRLGFSENYLDIQYRCGKCHDTGYANDKMCECMKKICRDIEYQKLNELSPLELSGFDTFSLEYYSDDGSDAERIMRRIFNRCKKYAEEFSVKTYSMLFQGGPGLGKTHLSLAIAQEVINSGYGVVYVSAPVIFDRIENEHFDFQKSEFDTISHLTECDLLIIDDLGTESITKFKSAAIYNIINARMLSSKPMIISTNMTLGEIENRYDERIVSRLIGNMARIEFVGSDIRQKKKRQNSKEIE